MYALKSHIFFSSIIFFCCRNGICLRNVDFFNNHFGYNDNKPLFLTPYIERGQFQLARQLSRSGKLPHVPDIESYSGLITVNKEFNSNIFFWFFPATNGNARAPVLLWLNGGPGISGLFGVFVEHGPYAIQANLTAKLRDIYWAMKYNVIYVDNPVGTGFSFTDDVRGYVTNENKIAEDLVMFLQQFFSLFYKYRTNEFYITGESYAGKYAVVLAHKIHKMGSCVNFKLTGVAIGSGLYELETMLNYSDYFYNIGLIDENQAAEIKSLSDEILKNIQSKNYIEALRNYSKLIIEYYSNSKPSLFRNFTGFESHFNYLKSKEPEDFKFYEDYVKLPEIKKALHLGNLQTQNKDTFRRYLASDIAKSVKPNVTVVLNNYRVLFYNAQLDVIVPYPSVLNFLRSVPWKYAEEYKRSKRQIWYLKGTQEIAGYVHNIDNFYEILVRNAGHFVSYDKPEVAFDLISRFVNREEFM